MARSRLKKRRAQLNVKRREQWKRHRQQLRARQEKDRLYRRSAEEASRLKSHPEVLNRRAVFKVDNVTQMMDFPLWDPGHNSYWKSYFELDRLSIEQKLVYYLEPNPIYFNRAWRKSWIDTSLALDRYATLPKQHQLLDDKTSQSHQRKERINIEKLDFTAASTPHDKSNVKVREGIVDSIISCDNRAQPDDAILTLESSDHDVGSLPVDHVGKECIKSWKVGPGRKKSWKRAQFVRMTSKDETVTFRLSRPKQATFYTWSVPLQNIDVCLLSRQPSIGFSAPAVMLDHSIVGRPTCRTLSGRGAIWKFAERLEILRPELDRLRTRPKMNLFLGDRFVFDDVDDYEEAGDDSFEPGSSCGDLEVDLSPTIGQPKYVFCAIAKPSESWMLMRFSQYTAALHTSCGWLRYV